MCWDLTSFGTLGQDRAMHLEKHHEQPSPSLVVCVLKQSWEWGPADRKAGTPAISGPCAAVHNRGYMCCKMLWELARIRQKCYFLTLLDSYFVLQAENRWRQLELGVALQYSLCLCYDSIFQLFNKRNHALILKAKNKSLFWIFLYFNIQ